MAPHPAFLTPRPLPHHDPADVFIAQRASTTPYVDSNYKHQHVYVCISYRGFYDFKIIQTLVEVNYKVSHDIDIIFFNYKNKVKASVSVSSLIWNTCRGRALGHYPFRHLNNPVNYEPHFTDEEIEYKGN